VAEEDPHWWAVLEAGKVKKKKRLEGKQIRTGQSSTRGGGEARFATARKIEQ